MSADHMAQVRQLRALAGNQDDRLIELTEAARGLESRFLAWQTFGVRPRSLTDAKAATEGIMRILSEISAGGEHAG